MLSLSLRSLPWLASTTVAVTMLLAGPTAVLAQIPRPVSFHGVLADGTGKPKPNATYTVTFRLYDAPTGGSLLWTEANKPVVVAGGKGLFSTWLGAPPPWAPTPSTGRISWKRRHPATQP